jgi:lauroyl/myristoyl acyltransferase
MISYLLYRTASALAAIVPRPYSTKIAETIALLFFACRPAIRGNVRVNYERLGCSRARTYRVFRNFSLAVTDLLRLSHMSPEKLRGTASARGLEHLDRALRKGKGAILVAPHLGPWEIAGAYLSSSGYPLHTVALEHPSGRVTSFFSRIRKRWGFRDYPPGSSASGLMKALRGGEPVVLLIDRNFSRRGMRLSFFGRDTLLPDGHIALSLRSGAPLLPSCAYYGEGGAITIVIGEEIPPPAPGAPPEALGRACLERMEEFIRAHPDQWFAFDHVWQEERDA